MLYMLYTVMLYTVMLYTAMLYMLYTVMFLGLSILLQLYQYTTNFGLGGIKARRHGGIRACGHEGMRSCRAGGRQGRRAGGQKGGAGWHGGDLLEYPGTGPWHDAMLACDAP